MAGRKPCKILGFLDSLLCPIFFLFGRPKILKNAFILDCLLCPTFSYIRRQVRTGLGKHKTLRDGFLPSIAPQTYSTFILQISMLLSGIHGLKRVIHEMLLPFVDIKGSLTRDF